MKRLFILGLFLAATFLPTASVSAKDDGYQHGDVNCDGIVSADDARAIMIVYVMGNGYPHPYGGDYSQPVGCNVSLDLNCDRVVNMDDVIAVKAIMDGHKYPTRCRWYQR